MALAAAVTTSGRARNPWPDPGPDGDGAAFAAGLAESLEALAQPHLDADAVRGQLASLWGPYLYAAHDPREPVPDATRARIVAAAGRLHRLVLAGRPDDAWAFWDRWATVLQDGRYAAEAGMDPPAVAAVQSLYEGLLAELFAEDPENRAVLARVAAWLLHGKARSLLERWRATPGLGPRARAAIDAAHADADLYGPHDLRGVDVDGLVAFLCDRAPRTADISASAPDGRDRWEFAIDAEPGSLLVDTAGMVRTLTAAFSSDAWFRWPPEQWKNGIWHLGGNWVFGGQMMERCLADPAVPLAERVACVEAMARLVRQACEHGGEDVAFMWWDLALASRWNEPDAADADALREAAFRALAGLLHDPRKCLQAAALHGLGHLRHPGTREVVAALPGLDPGLQEYARAAARFEVV